MNKNIVYAGIGIIIALLVAVLITISGKDTSTAAAAHMNAQPELNAKSVADYIGLKEEQDTLEDIISVNDPFSATDSQGMTLSTSAKDPFTNLVATMDFDVVNSEPIVKDGNFSDTLMANTSVTSQEDVKIVHRLKYLHDSVLVWTDAVGDNFSWNQKPSRQLIPYGSEVIVTYSTKDASGVWVGDITIDKPQT